MHKFFIFRSTILVTFLLFSAQAEEMKCAPGKCSTGKNMVAKVPQKSNNENSNNETPDNEKTDKKETRQNSATVKQLFNVRSVKIKKMQSSHKQTNYGYIVADDSLRVDVVAWYSGFIETLYADTLYTLVKKGEALAKVYSPEVYKAKQDYLNSINFHRKRSSPDMVESARVKLELLGVSSNEIKEIRKRRKVDRYTTITAPASGWIFKKEINHGSSFKSMKKLFEIISLKQLWVEVKLYQNELEKIGQLDNFTVKVKGISQTFKAQKSLLYPQLNPKEATATLRLEIDNSSKLLKPGMYAKVYASSGSSSRLVIPRTAAIRKNGTWYAFLATEFKGEYEPVKLELKPLDNNYFELLSGLNEGDTVVNNALFMMDSDAQINSIY